VAYEGDEDVVDGRGELRIGRGIPPGVCRDTGKEDGRNLFLGTTEVSGGLEMTAVPVPSGPLDATVSVVAVG
jgi:hypothetical protein